MSAPKTYLKDPEFEDQIAPRSWLSAFYLFRDRLSAASPAQHRQFVARLRQNLDEAVRRVPRFGAELEEQPDGRIRLAVVEAGRDDDGPGLLHESPLWEHAGIDDLLPIVEQPGAPRNLLLPDLGARTARVDVLRVRDGVCVAFHAHHSVADGATFAKFVRSVVEGGPLSLPGPVRPPSRSPTTAEQDSDWFRTVSAEMKVYALRDAYTLLADKGGPAQPAEPHRSFAPPTESKTYRVSKTKCKAQISENRKAWIAENPEQKAREFTVFEFLAAHLAAHAITARLDAAEAWGKDATIWIPVDVRDVVGRGPETHGNTVVPAAVDLSPPVCLRASWGLGDEVQRQAVEFIAKAISDTIRIVRTREWLLWRQELVHGIAEKDVRDFGVGFHAADSHWVHVNDARHFGADFSFPCLGKADAVRRHVPSAPGIQLHPTREGDDAVVFTVTLPKEAMENLYEHRYFVDFMKDIEAAPSE
ncbi:hypothetical protein PG985_003565 [Apiospora marii]|uniref:Condensation domain-containing protein n=1 Tax=Apiospora marii TaxID=335849 RepID=A0ABR1SJG0_9PEZI